jgi:hypothetical protein
VAGNEIDEIRAQRFAFLLAVYRLADGDTQEYVNWDPIAEELGFDSSLATKIVIYLREENLLEEPVMGNVVLLTHWGLKEVEEALSAPDEPLSAFHLTQNIIQIESMTNSQISQGSPGASRRRRSIQMRAEVAGVPPLEFTRPAGRDRVGR